ncbi:hypothetical protein RVR_2457 [Actinacidiphila reveromycinica]|uniref:Uncharacterized protein n=1 Tax=Actinacidiphila reveromycinica TaxID=659352 RepID=A0A7U3UQQ4_9ACTN|nr:hypothetical protein RVR_2457 [Streptomyces sp. SN-593]
MTGRTTRRVPGRLWAARGTFGPRLEVSGTDRVLIVHEAGAVPDHLDRAAAELRRRSHPADRVTVLTGAGFDDHDALLAALVPALANAGGDGGPRTVRLAMARAGTEADGQPALAHTLADALPCDVVAPAGLVVVAPGGTLFAPDLPGVPGGWWRFSPGLTPRRTGTRLPAPAWQNAVERAAPPTADGCVVEQIPAGLLVLPVGAPPEDAGALCYAVPVDPDGPLLLVGSSRTAAVPPDVLAEVIAALPGPIRSTVRLVPGGGTDLLAAGQGVADLLGIPVRVSTGMPLLLDAPSGPTGSPRTFLTDADGEPSWRPYVEVVTCEPASGGRPSAPRLGTWRPPIGGLKPGLEPGAMMLDRKWEVVVTRAGLWVGPVGSRVPEEIAARPVAPDLMALDVGIPEQTFQPSVWEALDRLFTALQDDVRERTFVRLHGDCSTEDLRDLRRLAMRHDLAVAPRDRLAGRSAAGLTAVGPAPADTADGGDRTERAGDEEAPAVLLPMSSRAEGIVVARRASEAAGEAGAFEPTAASGAAVGMAGPLSGPITGAAPRLVHESAEAGNLGVRIDPDPELPQAVEHVFRPPTTAASEPAQVPEQAPGPARGGTSGGVAAPLPATPTSDSVPTAVGRRVPGERPAESDVPAEPASDQVAPVAAPLRVAAVGVMGALVLDLPKASAPTFTPPDAVPALDTRVAVPVFASGAEAEGGGRESVRDREPPGETG